MTLSRAVSTGRLKKSLVYIDGQARIADIELAKQEMDANADYTDAPQYAPEQVVEADGSLADASKREKFWKANLAELAFKEKAGELVSKDEVEQEWGDLLASVRTKLLGIPTRVKQKIPELTAKQGLAIEELIREALEGLAGGET